jgi:energy-coupling factor transport system substrate-specific component
VGTALLTHLGLELWSGFGWLYAPWVICSIATALIVGTAARLDRFSSVPQLVIVVLLVSLANALCGALLHTLLYGGFADHSTDSIVQGFHLLTGNLLWASFWARVPINFIDKGLALIVTFLLSQRLSNEA